MPSCGCEVSSLPAARSRSQRSGGLPDAKRADRSAVRRDCADDPLRARCSPALWPRRQLPARHSRVDSGSSFTAPRSSPRVRRAAVIVDPAAPRPNHAASDVRLRTVRARARGHPIGPSAATRPPRSPSAARSSAHGPRTSEEDLREDRRLQPAPTGRKALRATLRDNESGLLEGAPLHGEPLPDRARASRLGKGKRALHEGRARRRLWTSGAGACGGPAEAPASRTKRHSRAARRARVGSVA
jgi:hypothetical protein